MRWQKLWARQNTYHFQRVNQGSYYVAEPATQPSLVALVWRLFVFSFMITIIHCITLENILISKTETPLLKCQLLFTWPHSKAPMSPDFIIMASKESCRGMRAWEWGHCVYSITSQSALSKSFCVYLSSASYPDPTWPGYKAKFTCGLHVWLDVHRLTNGGKLRTDGWS